MILKRVTAVQSVINDVKRVPVSKCKHNAKKSYARLYFIVATVPPIVKTVYLLRTKSCARFGLNFSIILLY